SDGGFEEDAPQRNDRDDHTDERGDAHGDIDPVPPRVPIEGQLHAAPAPRRSTGATMSLAKMLMINDMSMRTRPSSMNALNSSGVSASVKLLAIQLAIVCPWSNRETEITFLLPIVMVTAIVSPTARPKPRMMAPKSPARAYRSTASRVVSHRVAPRLSAASRWLSGTARKASRDTDEMVGMIMIARMTPALSLSSPIGVPWKIGRKPKIPWMKGSIEVRMTGARTKMPHRP